jgi:hypothetical protein
LPELRQRLEKRRERPRADEWIRHGFESRYRWRVAELTDDRERRLLARELRGVVGEIRGTHVPGATPLRCSSLRAHVATLQAIVDRLAALDRPVSAAGVIAVQELLGSPDSVLYAPSDRSGARLASALARLETI